MEAYVLTCCSTADMDKEFFLDRQIPYVSFHFTIDGETYPDDLGESYSLSQFYDQIKKGSKPTTSQVNIVEYCEFFEPILKQGKNILHVTLSSGISGTYNSACAAASEMRTKYPDKKIVVLDSLGASSGYGLLIDAIANFRDQGLGLEETAEWVLNKRLTVHHWFFSADLSSFKRGGRISATSAMLGTVLNICPLMTINDSGQLVLKQKIRTKHKAIREMVKQMELHADHGENYDGPCFISHSAAVDDAREVSALIEDRFPHLKGNIVIHEIGTVIGSHTGPGTVALFFFGDVRGE
ncbi:DegV family protein [Clostridium sp. E02]|uniref:DegV family protein n=1 Tax=Clostridium sp. E02 TaxID=2487134 RepID=UPI000F52EC89|nr:DegV family protein [Clostridium sp. E02]